MTNVALVVLDTLRTESFDRHFSWLPGVRFEEAWSTGGWTVPAHGSLFTGRYPSETGVYAKTEALDVPEPVLAEHLTDAGYTTRAFSANAYISPAFDFDRGFSAFETTWRGSRRADDLFEWGEFISRTSDEGPTRYLKGLYECVRSEASVLPSLAMGLRLKARDLGIGALGGDDDGAQEALEYVSTTTFGDDEFLYLNLMEAHSPYKPPADYRTVDVDESPGIEATVGDGPEADPDQIEQAYEDSVRYLADVYEDIFDELAGNFDYVVTLGDHGECFGEYGVWSHNYGIDPVLARIPLSLYRGDDEETVVSDPVSLVDVFATITAVANCPAKAPRGRHLLADNREASPRLLERFGLTGSHVEVLQSMGLDEDTIEAWDRPLRGLALEDGGYVWEAREGFRSLCTDLSDDEIATRLDRKTANLDVREVDPADRDLDRSVEERLERLGYA
jgi:arylsulfatase A-like enzyme